MKKQKIALFMLVLAVFMLYSSLANAVSIGISPGRVRFENVLREGYAQRTVTISTGSDEDMLATIRPNPETAEWVRFEPNATSFIVSREKPYLLTIIAQPPPDLPAGNYSGAIEVVTEGIVGPEGRAGASVKTAVLLLMNLEISGTQIIKCRAGGFSFSDAEVGFPFEAHATVINDGNVRISPAIKINIWDQLQENLILTRELTGDLVLPTTQKRMQRTIANELPEGQYWADLQIEQCSANSLSTFSVVERGAIVDRGDLVDIINRNPRAVAGETVQITAKFQNSGPRSVNAVFKGAIRLDEKIVQLIETDEIIVPSGESGDFDIFFIPESQGRYTLSGRVVYNKKLTFEKETVINVSPREGEDEKKQSWVPLLVYVLIIITAIFLIRKIREEKKKRKI